MDRREAAEYRKLSIPCRWRLTHARVVHQLAHAAVARWLIGPLYPADDDRLAILRLHSAPEIRDLAAGNVDAPAVQQTPRTFLLEQPGDPDRVVDELLATAVRNAGHHAVKIAEPADTADVETRLKRAID